MKVGFIDTVHPILSERLTESGFECVDLSAVSNDELQFHLEGLEGIVIRSRVRMDENLLRYAPDLKFIARSGAGMENIDQEYCKERNIALFNAPEGNRNAVAEHALGMLLALFNNVTQGNRQVRAGVWDRERNRGIELEGKTIGIIGYGNNGSQFAKVLSGFDVRILAYDKYKSEFGNDRVEEVSIQTLFNETDVLSLHVPLTEETLHMIDLEFIGKFSKPIYLINLARGQIVKTEDLARALEQGAILGACLDVLEFESSSFEQIDLKAHPEMEELLKRNNVIFSPHVGGWTVESYRKLSDVLADKILAKFS